ncbi:DcaP family trimeric outer membrane transporter [Bdellovibrio sp. HCB337]|uniref:DcaP family trimeric outer membrane transporter n=1 Tax=Bdellovibrio sp. HCB337 TaxID=3394358 RepID=UPI0039A6E889
MNRQSRLGLGLGLVMGVFSSQAMALEGSGFEVYGFAQVDYIQDFNRVNPAWEDTLRPSRIPATEGEFGSDGQASVSGKQSRLGVQASLPVDGKPLYTKFEFDFFGVGVDEGKTTPRFRHAYGQWGNWLGGQTNSLFMDIDAFPNIIDYWGPTGMVFYRTPQIRWTPMQSDNSHFAVAIEIPGNSVDFGGVDAALAANMRADEKTPDITAQWRMGGGWGHVQLAGIARTVGFDSVGTVDNEPSDHKTGWGVDLTTNIKFAGKNKLILGVVSGEGISNYMNDGGMDMSFEGTPTAPTAKLTPLTGYIAYYDHYWSDQWSSSIGVSQTEVKNTELQTATTYNRGQYASLNLLHTPHKNILMGGEILWGSRRSKDDTENDDSRIQISMKYNFSSKDF